MIACMGLCTAIKQGGCKTLIGFSVLTFLSTLVTLALAVSIVMVTITGKRYLDN